MYGISSNSALLTSRTHTFVTLIPGSGWEINGLALELREGVALAQLTRGRR